MRFWLQISICQSSMMHKDCWMNWQTGVGNLEASTVCWRESTRHVQLSGDLQAAEDHVCRVVVEDLVLSQVDKPERHLSAHEISHETAILCSSVHRKIIHRDLQLTCFKWCRGIIIKQNNMVTILQLISYYCSIEKISNLRLNSWYLGLDSFPR